MVYMPYSRKAAPLTNLLKKDAKGEWSQACQDAFEDLKKEVTEGVVLAFPDHSKAYEVHTDAAILRLAVS